MKHPRVLSAILFLSPMALAQSSSAPERHSWAPLEEPELVIIAQAGSWNDIMAEKCREWERNKSAAPPSAAWTCVNGRPATQQETNESIDRLHKQGEQTWKKMAEQQRKQQEEIQKIIGKYSGDGAPQNRSNVIERQRMTRLGPSQPSTPALSLPAEWSFAHPHADMLMAVDVAALGESAILQELLKRLPEPVQVNAKNFASQLRQVGEVEQAWLSIRSGDFLILFQGRLNFPPGFVQLRNGMSSYRISKTAVVFGRTESVAEAVQRLSRGAAPSLVSRGMKALSAGNAIAMTGTRAFQTQPTMSVPDSNDLSGFSLGLALHDELKLQMRLNSETAAGAQRLLASMRKTAASSDSSVRTDAQLDGTAVRLTLAIPKAYLLQGFDKALSSPMGQRFVAMASTQSVNKVIVQGGPGVPQEVQTTGQMVPAADSNAPFSKIVVQGMPEGTKVIVSPH